jgi:hypothetical protein
VWDFAVSVDPERFDLGTESYPLLLDLSKASHSSSAMPNGAAFSANDLSDD